MGETLYVSYGQHGLEMVKELLHKVDVAKKIPSGARIGLKPNLVVARPSQEGATTAPEVVEGAIQYLQEHGFSDLVILEGSWIGASTQHAFQVCGYADLAQRYGIDLVDLQQDGFHTRHVEGLDLKVCNTMNTIDYLINFPVLKGHCQTKITCALKNLKGCIPNGEKRRFHSLGLHRPIAYLSKAVPIDLVVVDGLLGDLDFEEGGNPVQMDRIILGTDPVLVDSYVAHLLGWEPADIPYIELAARLEVGRIFGPSSEVVVLNAQHTTDRIKPTRQVQELARHITEDQACSACYGSLIHALGRLRQGGFLDRIPHKFVIGQGFQGQGGMEFGVGSCTRGFDRYVQGCPPTAREILDFLLDQLG